MNLNIFHTSGVPADMDSPDRPLRNPTNKSFAKKLRQAAHKGWRLDESEARVLVEEGIALGHIDKDRAARLIDKLKYGQVYLRTDGQWACAVCGGNCGQCGDTGFYGNIGMDMDVLGQTFERLIPTRGTSRSAPKSPIPFMVFWLIIIGLFVFIFSGWL